jgi:hypothetical protein
VLKLGLSDTRLLKVGHVETLAQQRTHSGEDANRSTWDVRDAEADHSSNPVRPHERRIPGYRPAPIMTYNHGLLLLQRIYEADDVAN